MFTVALRNRFPYMINATVATPSISTVIIAKVSMTLCSCTAATQGVNAKTNVVASTLRTNVIPTTASATIFVPKLVYFLVT
jgi:hypothetical protein